MPRPPKVKPMDPSILEAALEGLEFQKKQIEGKIAAVKAMMSGRAPMPAAPADVTASPVPAKKGNGRRRRTLSPEARERIAAAQKKRWAAIKKQAK